MSRHCSACGQALPDDCVFCVHCGVSLKPPAATLPPPQPQIPLQPAVAGQTGVSLKPPSAFSWTRAISAMLGALGLLGLLYRGWRAAGVGEPSLSPSAAATFSPSSSPAPAPLAVDMSPSASPLAVTADLGLAEGDWTVDPRDPKFSESDRGSFTLHREGAELRGPGPEKSSFRLWCDGPELVGEAVESDGKSWKMRWQWAEPGRRVRLSLTDSQGQTQEAVLIRPSDLPSSTPEAAPSPLVPEQPVLYEVRGDLNRDGRPEAVQVVGLEGQRQADTDARKEMRIIDLDSKVLFRSEPFQEPFHLDSDVYAQKPEERAGAHILAQGGDYPIIRLVFASASGNFVDFKFDGSKFVLAEIGD